MRNDKNKHLMSTVLCASFLIATRLEAGALSDESMLKARASHTFHVQAHQGAAAAAVANGNIDTIERSAKHAMQLAIAVEEIKQLYEDAQKKRALGLNKEATDLEEKAAALHEAVTSETARLTALGRELFNRRMEELLRGLPRLEDLEQQAHELSNGAAALFDEAIAPSRKKAKKQQ